jgi:hypothetical protein
MRILGTLALLEGPETGRAESGMKWRFYLQAGGDRTHALTSVAAANETALLRQTFAASALHTVVAQNVVRTPPDLRRGSARSAVRTAIARRPSRRGSPA